MKLHCRIGSTTALNYLFVWALCLLSLGASGQGVVAKYLVLLKDKANSPYSVTRPAEFLSARAIQRRAKQKIALTERDLPPNPTYLSQIQQTGATVWYRSRWANAVLVLADEATIQKIKALSFVKGLELNRSLASAPPENLATVQRVNQPRQTTELPAYGNSLGQVAQIGADKMHDKGFHGEGMLLAVLDDGFLNANTVTYLKTLFDDRRVVATYDFVLRQPNPYNIGSGHGTEVLSLIAATADNQLFGTAYKASFLLLRTEDYPTEKPIEEANWLFGAEYADSTGADIITASLGYTDFDPPYPSHTYAELDGKTTLISRAAQWASETGMVVLIAAGNEGVKPWRYIGAPADAPGVLAIGSVDGTGERAASSSVGPSADGRIKPDLAAWGVRPVVGSSQNFIGGTGSGTSLATPLVAGLAAGFWQAYPTLTAVQVTDLLRRSGSQYATPDNLLGYGIPNFERAAQLAAPAPVSVVLATAEPLAGLTAAPNPFADQLRLTGLPTGIPVELLMTDLTGRIVLQTTLPTGGASVLPIETGRLAAGLYLLRIQTDTAKRTLVLLRQP